MNGDWQLITETMDGACTSSPDSRATNNGVWEIVQVQPAGERAGPVNRRAAVVHLLEALVLSSCGQFGKFRFQVRPVVRRK